VRSARRLIVTLTALLTVVSIGWLDLITGTDVGFSLVYLIPIALAGWYGGITPAVIVATAAGSAWVIAELPWRGGDYSRGILLWNAFSRLVIYLSQGLMLALLRRDRDLLHRHALREAALARTDPTTGLPNGRRFFENAERELKRASSSNQPLCVIYVDLDNFKVFNDKLGHAAGDDILVEVGRVLGDSEGEHGFTARIGGDEFAVLLPGCRSSGSHMQIGERIVSRIRALGSVYPNVGFGATVGIAHFETMPESAVELIRAADDAMYTAKATEKGTVIVHEF
jgi:diguanylate cyclase (GGDEF)-like protein